MKRKEKLKQIIKLPPEELFTLCQIFLSESSDAILGRQRRQYQPSMTTPPDKEKQFFPLIWAAEFRGMSVEASRIDKAITPMMTLSGTPERDSHIYTIITEGEEAVKSLTRKLQLEICNLDGTQKMKSEEKEYDNIVELLKKDYLLKTKDDVRRKTAKVAQNMIERGLFNSTASINAQLKPSLDQIKNLFDYLIDSLQSKFAPIPLGKFRNKLLVIAREEYKKLFSVPTSLLVQTGLASQDLIKQYEQKINQEMAKTNAIIETQCEISKSKMHSKTQHASGDIITREPKKEKGGWEWTKNIRLILGIILTILLIIWTSIQIRNHYKEDTSETPPKQLETPKTETTKKENATDNDNVHVGDNPSANKPFKPQAQSHTTRPDPRVFFALTETSELAITGSAEIRLQAFSFGLLIVNHGTVPAKNAILRLTNSDNLEIVPDPDQHKHYTIGTGISEKTFTEIEVGNIPSSKIGYPIDPEVKLNIEAPARFNMIGRFSGTFFGPAPGPGIFSDSIETHQIDGLLRADNVPEEITITLYIKLGTPKAFHEYEATLFTAAEDGTLIEFKK